MPIGAIRPLEIGTAPPLPPTDPVVTPPTDPVAAVAANFTITTCGTLTRELFDSLLPLAYKDDDLGDPLWYYCCALCGMFQDLDDLARDDGEIPGWAKLVNLTDTPDEALDWLAQFVGIRPLIGITPATKRDRITSKEGFKRGSPQAMIAAAQHFLTGTKSVNIAERDTSPYHMSVTTYLSETPGEDIPTTNLILNPSFEVDTLYWSASGAGVAIARSTDWSLYGAASLKLTTNGGANDAAQYFDGLNIFSPGQQVTFSVYVRPTNTITLDLQLNENSSVPAFLRSTGGAPTVCPGGVVTRLSMTVVLGASTSSISVYVTTASAVAAQDIYIDGVQLERQPIATAFVVGTRALGSGPVGKALLSQKPAGIVLDYQVVPGQTYQQLLTNHATYTLVNSFYSDYNEVANDLP